MLSFTAFTSEIRGGIGRRIYQLDSPTSFRGAVANFARSVFADFIRKPA